MKEEKLIKPEINIHVCKNIDHKKCHLRYKENVFLFEEHAV